MAGLGTAASPCLVATCADLQSIAQALTLSYRVQNDVDCSVTSTWNSGAGFAPINGFSGDFDGNSLTIDGLFESSYLASVGLFGNASGTLHDVNLANVDIMVSSMGGANTGALAATTTGTVSRCGVTGTITTPAGYEGNVGGLVGSAQAAIANSTANISITGGSKTCGGLVGSTSADITDSTAAVQITTTGNEVGGLAGYATHGVTGCSTSGKVSGGMVVGGLLGSFELSAVAEVSGCVSSAEAHGTGAVGGLVGVSGGPISSSSATGAVFAADEAGGLCGSSSGPITRSFATGSVTSSRGAIGGLVGYSQDNVEECYATGAVVGSGQKDIIGGLVGNSQGSINNAYARGNVTSTGSYAGGLVGIGTSVENAYATGDVLGTPQLDAGGVGGILDGSRGPVFGTGAVATSAAVGGVAGTYSGLPDSSAWYVAPGTAAVHCDAADDASCIAIPASTGLSYFFSVMNPPMSSWSFGAGNPWSTVCDGISFPVLTFQNISDTALCK